MPGIIVSRNTLVPLLLLQVFLSDTSVLTLVSRASQWAAGTCTDMISTASGLTSQMLNQETTFYRYYNCQRKRNHFGTLLEMYFHQLHHTNSKDCYMSRLWSRRTPLSGLFSRSHSSCQRDVAVLPSSGGD